MKPVSLASLLLFTSIASSPNLTFAVPITFDFLELIENKSSLITGRLADGTDYSGPPLATAYEYFSWEKEGVVITAHADYNWVQNYQLERHDPALFRPSFVYLQPDFAGLAVCHAANCTAGSHLNYFDRMFLTFSEVVEVTDIEFSIGIDDSTFPPDMYEYIAYNTNLDMFGGPDGESYSLMGPGWDWSGSLIGDQLRTSYPEGTGSFIQSITVQTITQVPEPGTLGMLILGLLMGAGGHRCIRLRERQVPPSA